MHLFESLVALSLVALLLLSVSRRVKVPYPTLLAVAGMGFAALPFAPTIEIDPQLALALFIAPALLHAAYGASPRGLKRYWLPLVALAVVAVVLTTAAVAWIGVTWAALPLWSAVALGAIVAPPDAVASEAVTGDMDLPRRGAIVLQGESLLNDATALLIFGEAVTLATRTGTSTTSLVLGLAVPGGIAFGAVAALGYLKVIPLFARTLGASLVDFAVTFAIWLVAERLKLSPVLAIVTFGMAVARWRPAGQPARDRLQTSAVWSAAILVLNVVAFMLMGLQARDILTQLPPGERTTAIGFALSVLATVLVVRVAWVLAFRWIEGVLCRRLAPHWLPQPPPWRASIVIAWSGMRGLLTLATAFALPAGFPGRELIVLAAFSVVLGTLLIQGLTLEPLIRLLKIGGDPALSDKIGAARKTLIDEGLAMIAGREDAAATALRVRYRAAGHVVAHGDDPQGPSSFDALHLDMIAHQRGTLHAMRREGSVAEDVYRRLEEELDWAELDARAFSENILRAT